MVMKQENSNTKCLIWTLFTFLYQIFSIIFTVLVTCFYFEVYFNLLINLRTSVYECPLMYFIFVL